LIDPSNVYESHVGARLLDFFDTRSLWNRKLWNIGLHLTLSEILEAVAAVRAGVLSDASLDTLTSVARRVVGTDPGAGAEEERAVLQSALKPKLRPGGLDYYLIAQHQATIGPAYLSRWTRALRAASRPRAERAARAVASHLLDHGFSTGYMHRWWSYRIWHEPATRSLADLVEDAHLLALTPARKFEALMPVTTTTRVPPDLTIAEWRPPALVSEWLRGNDFDSSGIRQSGGLLFTVDACDPEAAVARVSEITDQLVARMTVSTRRPLKPLGQVWIKGEPKPYVMERAVRGVWVEALERENQLYNIDSSETMHAAIELLSHLQSSSPGAAVAGGWAAIEALLSEPDDRANAADRLAMLVACSFPRAELTALSYVLERRCATLTPLLSDVRENSRRCDIVADNLGQVIASPDALGASDRAAVARMSAVLKNPHDALCDIRDHAIVAFRRLYRQRNLVLHWGRTDAVALRASLRTAAPLVGAGIDRIIHAYYVDRLSPLQLVARAKMALATVGTLAGPPCTRLLG
jgi:hypothetical protein